MNVAQNSATALFKGNKPLLKFSLSTITTALILVSVSHHSAFAFRQVQDSGVIVTDDIKSEETYIITDDDGNIMEPSVPILFEKKSASGSKTKNKKLKLKNNKKPKVSKNKRIKSKKKKKAKQKR